jgi:hypothetical protein
MGQKFDRKKSEIIREAILACKHLSDNELIPSVREYLRVHYNGFLQGKEQEVHSECIKIIKERTKH